MSIERLERRGGHVWRVRWRDETGHNRAKVLGRKADAIAFDAEVRRLKRTGELAISDKAQATLAEFVEQWWRNHVVPNLAESTRDSYRALWSAHLEPRIGGVKLRDLTPELIDRTRIDMLESGVGPQSSVKAMVILRGALSRAVLWGWLGRNPAAEVPNPRPQRVRRIRLLPPATIELMRAILLDAQRPQDAALISALAYAGLRPQEAFALTWGAVGMQTLDIRQAVAAGKLGPTKTRRRRSVRLVEPLADDLLGWRRKSGSVGEGELLFPLGDGRPMTPTSFRNWRRRVWVPTALAADVQGANPYDCRHTFVSLLLNEGRQVIDVAAQAGHSPTVCLDTYGHLLDDVSVGILVPMVDAIAEARAEQSRKKSVPVLYPETVPA